MDRINSFTKLIVPGVAERIEMKVACPKCRSTQTDRCSTPNFVMAFLQMLLRAVLTLARANTIATLCGVDNWRIHYTCRRCGHQFRIPVTTPRDYDHCPKCDYNLTGNTSGRCPECGMQIPKAYQSHQACTDAISPPGKKRIEER